MARTPEQVHADTNLTAAVQAAALHDRLMLDEFDRTDIDDDEDD